MSDDQEPELIKGGEGLSPEEMTDLTIKEDESVIKDMVSISKSASQLEKQRKSLRLIGPHSDTTIRKNDLPEIQILKALADDYNQMDLEDELERQKIEDDPDNTERIHFLSEDRIKARRYQLESMARTLNSINIHVQKVHGSDTKMLNTMVKYRKQLADIEADSKAGQEVLDQERDAIDDIIGKENADSLGHDELLREAQSLGIDVSAVMGAKFETAKPDSDNDES